MTSRDGERKATSRATSSPRRSSSPEAGQYTYPLRKSSEQSDISSVYRKVGQVVFHPTASSILASASGDYVVRIWDVASGADSPSITLDAHGDSVQDLAWNFNGSLLATVRAASHNA